MPFQRKRSSLVLEGKEVEFLQSLAASRTEPYAKVRRAKMLLAYARGESISSIARRGQTDRPVVERCVDKALAGGIMTALQDLPRSGRSPLISAEDRAWVIHLACSRPADYGYAAERWTIAQLAQHIREHALASARPALARIGKSGVHNINQAVASLAPDLAPVSGKYAAWGRDHKVSPTGSNSSTHPSTDRGLASSRSSSAK